MEVYRTLDKVGGEARRSVALGLFDGVHLAHREVIRAAVSRRSEGLVPAVLAFRLLDEELPNKPGLRFLFSEEQRLERFASLGVEEVWEPEFSDIAALEPEEFLALLAGRLNARAVSCGYDYTFGRGAAGGVELLERFCRERGIALSVLPPFSLNGRLVSSSAIRELLAAGDIPAARALLGGPYDIWGEVLPGRRLGHTLGFPTINQSFGRRQTLPRLGVYRSVSECGGGRYLSITNVGVKPTLPGLREPLAETHLLGVEGDFYGQTARVELLSLLRDERKFADVDELRARVLRDIAERKREE